MKIIDFWEKYYRKIKIYEEKKKKGIFINKKEILKENSILNLEVRDRLRPKWTKKEEKIPIFFPTIYKNIVEGEILAFFVNKKEKFPAIIKRDKQIIFNFDPEETIKFLITEKYYKPKRRFYTYLPIHMHIIPGSFRKLVKSLLFSFKKGKNFPSWPIEKSVELIRYTILRSFEIIENKKIKLNFWPRNKKYVVCLTHDIETKEGLKRIPLMSKIEEKYKMNSSWSIVSNYYKINFSLLDRLVKKGNEILLHGYKHDNKLIHLNKEKMKKRFTAMNKLRSKYKIKGFRSPCLLRNNLLYNTLGEYNYLYDSSSIDTETLSQIAERNGCCTIFPYLINNLIEMPITLPLDSNLFLKNLTRKEIIYIWTKKLEFIKANRGIAVINTHPEPYLSGNKKNIAIYKEILEYISKDKTAWITTLSKAAEYAKKKIKFKNALILVQY